MDQTSLLALRGPELTAHLARSAWPDAPVVPDRRRERRRAIPRVLARLAALRSAHALRRRRRAGLVEHAG